MDRETEAMHLVMADRQIAEGEARIARQEALLSQARAAGGSDLAVAEALLALLRETLVCWQEHRALIVVNLAGGRPN